MKKTFDCVEMKRRGAEQVLAATRDLSTEDELAYWAERTAELRARQRAVCERGEGADPRTQMARGSGE